MGNAGILSAALLVVLVYALQRWGWWTVGSVALVSLTVLTAVRLVLRWWNGTLVRQEEGLHPITASTGNACTETERLCGSMRSPTGKASSGLGARSRSSRLPILRRH